MIPTTFPDVVDTGFLPFMIEANRTKRINDAIADFKYIVGKGKDPNLYIEKVLTKHGLSEDELTDSECKQIMRCINGLY